MSTDVCVCVCLAGAGDGDDEVQWCFSQVKGAFDDDIAEGKWLHFHSFIQQMPLQTLCCGRALLWFFQGYWFCLQFMLPLWLLENLAEEAENLG